MDKLMLLGDEAIAQGAIDAGISGIYAYPGTPSTEITEYVMNSEETIEKGIRAVWSVNEKTAMETAIGMSFAGKRAMVCMKHVGLNVASDAFINSAITGANGGLVIVVADDPSMHSSQNEQDSRFYGDFAMMPILEPSNQQEAYDMVHYSFDLSEKMSIPVLIRITTRLAHSRAGIERTASKAQNRIKLPSDRFQYILLPFNARKRYKNLLANQKYFMLESSESGYNKLFNGKDKSLGIVAAGIALNYLLENFPDGKVPYPVLKIGQYPLPRASITKLYNECDEILVLEDGFPFIESQLRGYMNNGKPIHGRLDNRLPRDGELNPNIVASALGLGSADTKEPFEVVKGRPPKLCKGCPHFDSFKALNIVMEGYPESRVFSDIGCYTLAAFQPLESIDSCVDMGASVTMAIGAADAGLIPSVAVIGDSTFTHSGITGLLDAVNNNTPITLIILDNSTTGMTGGQSSAAFEKLEEICKGIGVDEEHIRILKPLPKQHEDNVAIMKEELKYMGVSVIITRRECIQTLNKRMRAKHKAKI